MGNIHSFKPSAVVQPLAEVGQLGLACGHAGDGARDLAAVAALLRKADALVALVAPEANNFALGDRGGPDVAVRRRGDVPAVVGVARHIVGGAAGRCICTGGWSDCLSIVFRLRRCQRAMLAAQILSVHRHLRSPCSSESVCCNRLVRARFTQIRRYPTNKGDIYIEQSEAGQTRIFLYSTLVHMQRLCIPEQMAPGRLHTRMDSPSHPTDPRWGLAEPQKRYWTPLHSCEHSPHSVHCGAAAGVVSGAEAEAITGPEALTTPEGPA